MASGRSRSAPAAAPSSTRERILDGAREVVQDRGIAPLTTELVLVAAGVSRRTFYQYFKSGEALLAALYEREMKALVSQVAEAAAVEGAPVDRVGAALDAWLAVQWRGGRVLVLLEAEAVRPDSALAALRERTLTQLGDVIDRLVRDSAGIEVDPLTWRAVLVGLEGVVLDATAERGFTPTVKKRIRAVTLPFVFGVLMNAPHLARLPKRKRAAQAPGSDSPSA